jgi:hypothetical protein
MTTCEKCGKTFNLPEGPVEVTSTRILCPECRAERELLKKRQAAARAEGAAPPAKPRAAGAAPAARPAAPAPAARPAAPAAPAARPAARPVAPAAKPAAPVAKPAAPAAKPASPAAKPAAPAARPAAPVARPAAAASARAAAPATRASRTEAPPARSRAARAVEEDEDDAEPRGKRGRHEQPAEPVDRTVMIGWIAALVISAAAVGFYFKVKAQKDHEKAVEAARVAELADIVTKIQGFDLTVPDQARELITYAEDTRVKWEPDVENATDILSRISRSKNTIETEATRKETQEKYDAIQAKVSEPAKYTADELIDLRRSLDEVEARASIMGKAFAEQLAASRMAVDHTAADKLLEEAKAASAGGPENQRTGLQKYAKAEDELLRLLEKATNSPSKDEQNFYTARYRQCIAESDALCTELFTPDYIQKIARRDLLSGDDAAKWNPTKGLEGFSHELTNGTLHLKGPVNSDGRAGVISIGDLENWRDFVLEYEFTLVAGNSTTYMRLGKAVNYTVPSLAMETEGQDAITLGQKYTTTVSFIGSNLDIVMEEGETPRHEEVGWTKNRKGAIGIVVPEGAELLISRMRIRVLR